MNTIDNTLSHIREAYNLSQVLCVMYEHYLTPREKELYEIFVLHLQGKPQHELGILLGKTQGTVSQTLSKFKSHLNKLGVFLVEHHEDIDDLMHYLKGHHTRRHYMVMSYLFGGNSYKAVAKRLRITPRLTLQIPNYIKKRLPPEYLSLFKEFCSILFKTHSN